MITGEIIQVVRWRCSHCEHKWIPRNLEARPFDCPKCRRRAGRERPAIINENLPLPWTTA